MDGTVSFTTHYEFEGGFNLSVGGQKWVGHERACPAVNDRQMAAKMVGPT